MMATTRTFEEASKHIQASLQKHLDTLPVQLGSSDNSDSEDETGFSNDSDIIDRVLNGYELGREAVGGRTKEALIETLKTGAGPSSCLICISSLKRSDAIWTCDFCFCSMHLNCIQRWGKDNIFQQKNDHENQNHNVGSRNGTQSEGKVSFKWGCPKCRQTYIEELIPKKYLCYCKKEEDPKLDPWLVPHSCGNQCSKPLNPLCGHRCLILCHPGPCPPCPKMLLANCFCGQSAPAQRRCFQKGWSCRKSCNKALNCSQHACQLPCHPGECPPCKKKSWQLCQCHRNKKELECSEPNWQCKEPCRKPLGCRHHLCDEVCHKGECDPCPLSQLRHCPCGKSTHQLPCTVATPTCPDTCGKVLACGSHVCAERCHRGECGTCQQIIKKRCKCGARQRDMVCSKEYVCDIKCKNMRDCKKHTCNKKCCDGASCLPCEQQCNKTLACKNHKCPSKCHQGACYPCTSTKEVTCFCGTSRILVPCGMERSVKPPKCKSKCKTPPDCHHPTRLPHACHFGECPPCKQTCETAMTCGHLCPAQCHDRVTVKVEEPKKSKAATPWEETKPTIEIKALPCPDCLYPVPVTCLGNHETSDWPCFSAKVGPCGRKCGRKLPCTNHLCERDCHKVKNAANETDAGANCRKCESECQKKRPEGCSHPCKKPCHPGECYPCSAPIRIRCHCGIAQLYTKCGEWTQSSKEVKEDIACCKDQCPKTMTCGHRCYHICHTGDCGVQSQCKKKLKLYCPCKRRKQDVQCSKSNGVQVECDQECLAIKQKAREAEQLEAERLKEEDERRKRLEAERFEKKFVDGKRRRRNRRTFSENVEKSFFQKWKIPILVVVPALVAIGALLWVKMGSESVSQPDA